MDLAVFSPLKATYQKKVDDYNLITDIAPTNKQKFSECYSIAQKETITKANINAGQKTSGLWPVNMAIPLKNSFVIDTPLKAQTPSPQSSPLLVAHSSPLVTPYGQVRTPRRSQEVRKLVFENEAIREAIRSDEIAKQFLDKVAIRINYKTIQLADYVY